MLTPLLMARVVQLLVPLYADKAPWKVRGSFSQLEGSTPQLTSSAAG
jgi:hypothetical protein